MAGLNNLVGYLNLLQLDHQYAWLEREMINGHNYIPSGYITGYSFTVLYTQIAYYNY